MKDKVKTMVVALASFAFGALTNHVHYYEIEDLPNKSAMVFETYTVKPGDTFWDITQNYRDKDCRNPYILEYKYELEKLNPHIKAGNIHTGDKIQIRYYIDD